MKIIQIAIRPVVDNNNSAEIVALTDTAEVYLGYAYDGDDCFQWYGKLPAIPANLPALKVKSKKQREKEAQEILREKYTPRSPR